MDYAVVYSWRGHELTEEERLTVISGSSAQDYGLSPWADWVLCDADRIVTSWTVREDRILREDGAEALGYRWEMISVDLPSGASAGDTCMRHEHGGSGTYQSWYVYDGERWQEQGTTVPWQLRV